MKKMIFIIGIVFLVVFTIRGQNDPYKYHSKFAFDVLKKDIAISQKSFDVEYNIYFTIRLWNKTQNVIDSVFGSFIISDDLTKLAIVDFENYAPVNPDGSVIFISNYRFSVPKDYSSLDFTDKQKILVLTDLSKLNYRIAFLEINYRDGTTLRLP
jgi:hypothetical protein